MAEKIPYRERELQAFAQTVLAYANANLAGLGLVAADTATFGTQVAASGTAFGTYDTAVNAAKIARATKDTGLAATEKSLRLLLKKLQANPNLSDAQREGLGLGGSGGKAMTLLSASALSANPAFTRPSIAIETPRKLQQVLSFREETTPDTKAKPKGVRGVQIWMAILPKEAPAPRDNQAMRFLGEPRALKLAQDFVLDDAGKYAWYLARWTDLAGEVGQWSEPASRMILA